MLFLLTVTTLFRILCAAIIQPVCNTELKHSTVNPIKPAFWWYAQPIVTEVLVTFITVGFSGGRGNFDESGALCRWTSSDDLWTVNEADHVVSPLSEEATHVYKPLSENCRSICKIFLYENYFSFLPNIIKKSIVCQNNFFFKGIKNER